MASTTIVILWPSAAVGFESTHVHDSSAHRARSWPENGTFAWRSVGKAGDGGRTAPQEEQHGVGRHPKGRGVSAYRTTTVIRARRSWAGANVIESESFVVARASRPSLRERCPHSCRSAGASQ